MLELHFFFFQAEDGIRDIGVTGVQTCALPILLLSGGHQPDGEIGESKLSVGMLDACSSLHRPVASRAASLPSEPSDRSITGWARSNALESSRHPWNAPIRSLSVSIITRPCASDLGHWLS